MVVSVNPNPEKTLFQSLLDNTVMTLLSESKKKEKEYLTFLGNKLEDVVAEVMKEKAKGTAFENSIELISGQKFPDIIANKFYGVEVKTSKQNHWTTTGNSVLEGTRVEGIERIYMLYGKMILPIEFRCRPYEDCLSEVVVTHSPRYLINMELTEGETIFNKLNIPYDTLRKSSNPVKHITDYYRKFLKPGEEVWWLDQDDTKSTGLIIQLWNNLPSKTRKEHMIRAMVLFPEIFGNRPDKFNRASVWLINSHGIVCPNIRDVFTAGGQGTITWKGKIYTHIPKVLIKLTGLLAEITEVIEQSSLDELRLYWDERVADPYKSWINLVAQNTEHQKLKINIRDYLTETIIG